jgi:hypothetical protein
LGIVEERITEHVDVHLEVRAEGCHEGADAAE